MNGSLAINGGTPVIQESTPDLFEWPRVTPEMEEAVLEVLRRGAMSDLDVTKEFEADFADWQETEYALGYSSGTASLWGAMYGVGVGVGDEVIVPSITFWASALPALGLGATPVFADIDPDSLCIDPASLEERIGPDTAAIVVVHAYGHPASMEEILSIADEHDIAVIEDVSHAHGARYRGDLVGTLGDVAAMSLMSEKSLAVGEAGMLVTDDPDIYERAVAFSHYRRHDEVLETSGLAEYAGLPFGGQKHRMHQLSAAVGRVQLQKYDEEMAEIQDAMAYFWEGLEGVPGLRPHRITDPESSMGGWYSPKGLYDPEEVDGVSVERVAAAVSAEGSSCNPGCNAPLHEHPLVSTADIYGHEKPTRIAHTQRDVRRFDEELPVSADIGSRCLTIPAFKRFDPEAIDDHVAAYRRVLENPAEL